MPRHTDPNDLRHDQYRDASNLCARSNLHARFSTHPVAWFHWMFDQFTLPARCRILELGCGPGGLWAENMARIPSGWDITLSDFSEGMLAQARQNLADHRPFRFEQIDAQQIPFKDHHFDAVIANHMLYHVPDRRLALAEIRRVLVPGGVLYAATNGRQHMRELAEISAQFDPHNVVDSDAVTRGFSLQNGPVQLETFFEQVEVRRYRDSLRVTEVPPLADYLRSTIRWKQMEGRADRTLAELVSFLEALLEARGGVIEITKDTGLIIAR